MCKFFSFVTEPENNGGKRFYFDWEKRKNDPEDKDSHSIICKHFKLYEDKCNKYEYNPLTRLFVVDQINSSVDDRVQAEEWVNGLDFKKVIKPLIIKPIINPLKKIVKPTEEHIELLKLWASVRASVRDSVWDSVRASVRDSVWDSAWASVGDSVRDSVWAYISTFFDIEYKYNFSPVVKLWEAGLVPSFDGKVWRLHSGSKAKIVFEITKEELIK